MGSDTIFIGANHIADRELERDLEYFVEPEEAMVLAVLCLRRAGKRVYGELSDSRTVTLTRLWLTTFACDRYGL